MPHPGLHQLRAFVEVADQLHFTRAAEAVGITQPSLSQLIRRLEDDLGVALLIRTSRRVELTPAGRVLRDRARRILRELDDALDETRGVAEGRAGHIRLGATGTVVLDFVPAVLRALRSVASDVRVSVAQLSTTGQVEGVREGRLDAGLTREAGSQPNLHTETLLQEPPVAVLPAGHALAGRRSVAVRELAGETFVLWPRANAPGLYDRVVEICRRAGYSPSRIVEAPDAQTELALIAAGMGVALQAQSFARQTVEGVTAIPIRTIAERISLDLVHATAPAPAVEQLARCAREVARARHRGARGRRRS